MAVLNQYEALFDLFKPAKTIAYSGPNSVIQRSDNNGFKKKSLFKVKNFNFKTYKNKFISPYNNFLKNYLWKKKEYSFVLFPFSIKFRKSTVIIKDLRNRSVIVLIFKLGKLIEIVDKTRKIFNSNILNIFFIKHYFSIFNKSSVRNYYEDRRFRFGIMSSSTKYLMNFHSNFYRKNLKKRRIFYKIKTSLSKILRSHLSFNFIFSKIINVFFFWLIYFFNWFFNHYLKTIFNCWSRFFVLFDYKVFYNHYFYSDYKLFKLYNNFLCIEQFFLQKSSYTLFDQVNTIKSQYLPCLIDVLGSYNILSLRKRKVKLSQCYLFSANQKTRLII